MVVGRVIEVVSGMSLREFMQTEVLDPMGSSAAWFPKDGDDLLPLFMFKAALEVPPRMDFQGGLVDIGTESFRTMHNHDGLLGIGGPAVWADGQMVGTADDVMRLCEVLTHWGRTKDGKQLLQPSSADLIMSNCLPDGTGLDWTHMPLTAPVHASFDENGSVGYGLGGMVYREGAAAKLGLSASPGAYHWYGVAGTLIQADPAKELSIVLMTQLVNASAQAELGVCGTLFQQVYEAIEE